MTLILEARGMYRGIRPWNGREAWIGHVADALNTDAGERRRRRHRVSLRAILDVAGHDARTADGRSGRSVATSNETVARSVHRSPSVVKRARAWLRDMGLAVTVQEGRYLTVEERARARAEDGSQQIRAASTRALIHPVESRPRRRRPDRSRPRRDPLPRRGEVPPTSPVLKRSPRRAVENRGPRDIRLQRLAGALAARMPWLVPPGQVHVGNLVVGLVQRGVPPTVTVGRLVAGIYNGIPLRDVAEQRHPLAYFLSLISADLVERLWHEIEVTTCATHGHPWVGQWSEYCPRCGIMRDGWRDDRDASAHRPIIADDLRHDLGRDG